MDEEEVIEDLHLPTTPSLPVETVNQISTEITPIPSGISIDDAPLEDQELLSAPNNEHQMPPEPTPDNNDDATPREVEVPNVEATPNTTTSNVHDTDDIIDSSAALFETQDNTNDDVFSSQTQEMAHQMATNFSMSPTQVNATRHHNYKFRKRPHLK